MLTAWRALALAITGFATFGPAVCATPVPGAAGTPSTVAAGEAQALDARSHAPGFPDAQLIGSWRGTLYENADGHAAELVLWSTQLWGLNKVSGYLAQTEPFCASWVIVNREGERNNWSASANDVRPATPRCDAAKHPHAIARGEGWFEASPDGTTLYLYADQGPGLTMPGPRRCVEGLTRPGCVVIGVFRRSAASAPMAALARTGVPPDFEPATAEVMTLLSAGAAPGEALQAGHTRAEADNTAIAARQRASREQAQEESSRRSVAESRAAGTAGRAGVAASSQRGPFDGRKGGAMLNAIYNGDFNEARRLDNAFAQALQRSLASDKRKPLPWEKQVQANADADADNTSLRVSVLKAFVMNYDKKYSSCLRPDAETLTVTSSTPDRTYFDNYKGYAIERRVQGSNSSADYRVNTEFVPVFRKVYNRGSMASLAAASLLLTRDDKAVDAALGIIDMMDIHACDSAVGKTMAQRLLELHKQIFDK